MIATIPHHARACDPVAAAVEEHLQEMEAHGSGPFIVEADDAHHRITLSFGTVTVQGETCDIALVRLAGRLLNDAHAGASLLNRLRGQFTLASQESGG